MRKRADGATAPPIVRAADFPPMAYAWFGHNMFEARHLAVKLTAEHPDEDPQYIRHVSSSILRYCCKLGTIERIGVTTPFKYRVPIDAPKENLPLRFKEQQLEEAASVGAFAVLTTDYDVVVKQANVVKDNIKHVVYAPRCKAAGRVLAASLSVPCKEESNIEEHLYGVWYAPHLKLQSGNSSRL